jgi:hypothetical protein
MRGGRPPFIGLTISVLALVGFILLASVFKQDTFLQRDLAFTQQIHAHEESPISPFLDIVADMGKVVGGYAIGLCWLAVCLSLHTLTRAPMRTGNVEETGN